MRTHGYPSPKTPPTSLPQVDVGPASGVVVHEVWCGLLCDHEDCGHCTCPRRQRSALHPHFDVERPPVCPWAYQHHLMFACGRCGYKAPARPAVQIWNTPTTSSGRFDEEKLRGNPLAGVRRDDRDDWDFTLWRMSSAVAIRALYVAWAVLACTASFLIGRMV